MEYVNFFPRLTTSGPGHLFRVPSAIRGGDYDWANIERLVRSSERIAPAETIETVEARFNVLRELTELEQQVIVNANSGWNNPLDEPSTGIAVHRSSRVGVAGLIRQRAKVQSQPQHSLDWLVRPRAKPQSAGASVLHRH
ncbi:hypothetical protein ACFL5O_08595 [Myxococcota bacterium]